MTESVTMAIVSGEAAPEHRSPDTEVRERLEYDGSGVDLATIAATNAIATLATLGVYRFWGKTRVRRYLWSRVGCRGDQGEYSGTGMELLRGFLVALPVLALLFGSSVWIQMMASVGEPVYWFLELVSVLIFFFLICVAAYLARRYRLSRTEWRGIRFAQDGSSIRYALLVLGWSIVVVLSLGTAYAVYRTRLQHYRTTHTSFGNRRFRFEARAAALLKPWLLAWLFLLPSLGLTYCWYRVKEFRYFAQTTHCGAFSFKSELRARSVILILIVGLVVDLDRDGLSGTGPLQDRRERTARRPGSPRWCWATSSRSRSPCPSLAHCACCSWSTR